MLYLRQHYHFGPGRIADYLKRFHQHVAGGLVGASHPGAARHEPAAGEPEASAAREALAALREAPAGHRLQLDVKFLERIPGTRKRLYQFTAIDDCTRHSGAEGVRRVQPAHGHSVHRRSPAAAAVPRARRADGQRRRVPVAIPLAPGGLDIRHVYIRPRTPHLNGKVERSHRVDDQEFYQLLDKDGITDDIHLFNEKLREWEDYYNYHRPHGALDGQTPYERLVAKTRAGSSPAS